MVTAKELYQLGKEMRCAQKKYFKSRTSENLEIAKSLEKEFDNMLDDFETRQPNMFDQDLNPNEG
jgi:hypothetical protein